MYGNTVYYLEVCRASDRAARDRPARGRKTHRGVDHAEAVGVLLCAPIRGQCVIEERAVVAGAEGDAGAPEHVRHHQQVEIAGEREDEDADRLDRDAEGEAEPTAEPVGEGARRNLEGEREAPEDALHDPDLRERNVAELGQIEDPHGNVWMQIQHRD